MAYQNAGTPRFYINNFSKEINPTTISTYLEKDFSFSFDLIPNYVMLLGISSGLTVVDDQEVLRDKVNDYDIADGFTLAGYALMDYANTITDGIITVTGDLSELVVGRYYDMPHSPDLSLSMSHSYEGIKTTQTKGGVTLSHANYHKPSKWGDLEAWELKPSSGSYSADLGYRYSGRRSWDLSFSYISDTDLEPYNYSGIEYTQDTGGGGYGAGTDNWFTNVLYYTMGGHLPFIFCPDPSIEYTAQQDETYLYPRTPEFAICRLDMDSFKRDQVASNVYNIKIKIVESW